MEKELMEYWEKSENIFPDVIQISKTFGITYEQVCDILFKGYNKTKNIQMTSYCKPNWYKGFSNPYTYILTKTNSGTKFIVQDGNTDTIVSTITDIVEDLDDNIGFINLEQDEFEDYIERGYTVLGKGEDGYIR